MNLHVLFMRPRSLAEPEEAVVEVAREWVGAEGAPPLLCYVLEGGLQETPQKPGSESSYKYRQALLDGLHGATAGCMVPLTLGPCQGAGQR